MFRLWAWDCAATRICLSCFETGSGPLLDGRRGLPDLFLLDKARREEVADASCCTLLT